MLDISRRSSYYWLDTWVLANVIQLATQDFCSRYLNLKNDPCGRLYDQMTMAARSTTANIAEGNSRHSTSRETEMKLTDVARASLAELSNDYFNWLLVHEETPWSINDANHQQLLKTNLDKPTYTDDVQHLSAEHILRQKQKFSTWLNANDSLTAARCLIVLSDKLTMMLNKQMKHQQESFTEEGGFTEALSRERLQHRAKKSEEQEAPVCPKCGKPMIQRVAKKGTNAGKPFWSCSGYPECQGTRKIK